MEQEALKSLLPPEVAGRLQALSARDGKVSLVLDVTGLADRGASLESQARGALEAAEGVSELNVALVADRKRRRIVAVASGKGGVGKSTLTANLAVALHRTGRKVGIVDADIYGPSQPTLLATEDQRPTAREKQLIPIISPSGVAVLSMGHLAPPGQAIAWRGPMAGNALGQLVEADWGDAEILLIDLPPGTGDIQMTMVQRYKPDGAIIVSTPQDLALIDAMRAMQLFEKVGVPVIGLVENMSGYICPHCGEGSDPFGRGGAQSAATERGLPFLGRVPLALGIREASDAGAPPAGGEGPDGEAFRAIAAQLSDWLDAQGGSPVGRA